ncbi:MAG: hypothetical protein ABI127_01435 [Dokdonella sp.]
MKKFSTQAGNRKPRFARSAVLASLAMAAATVGSSQAFAAVFCSSTPIAIPADINGVYVNFVTGASGTSGAGTAGWDFSAYASGGTLRFYSSAGAANTTQYVGTGTTISLLAAGTMIDASSALSPAGVVLPGAFQAGVTNGYVGVKFRNEGTAASNYGWATVTTTGPNGFPATLTGFCYQNDGTGIMAGTTPVSLQSYSID